MGDAGLGHADNCWPYTWTRLGHQGFLEKGVLLYTFWAMGDFCGIIPA